ncbi:hydroxymethylglutaryl-CoA reductase, degradative [Bacteroidetes bacterium endosymbiont of Geopemphigus sp.]|uniref:hydroxymethylglutaryl-CoA reductase, degradative n=1 Tax=Bacteroidetes bacterium endosymbiont of Geopemphigus sp. TaxID=2047937 RepID=UPI000CD0D4B1|nr:hydroxymethylglutaryl-CoA reductase, degradative [Bacteroidetes bacterium endosymbiont of Geopemphigus sp.]
MSKFSEKGFSRWSKEEKINWLLKKFLKDREYGRTLLKKYSHPNSEVQSLHEEFSENTLTNFYLPFGIAPGFLINGREYALPMVIEESSVVAAAAKAAKFWKKRGGFKAQVRSVKKSGQVHFLINTSDEKLQKFFRDTLMPKLLQDTDKITTGMRARGGGILQISLKDKSKEIPYYFQIDALFDTCDAMGANFINSCLEQFAFTLKDELIKSDLFDAEEKFSFQVIMAILSNYTPDCLARAQVSCSLEVLTDKNEMSPQEFAEKFHKAVHIAQLDPYRAVTHNKGIMNGVDAVALATGNDFRALESNVHAYAAHSGRYMGLTRCEIRGNTFHFWLDLPLAVGTIGGLTSLHPMAAFSLEVLGRPSSQELMIILASSGLAQNFAALRSLVTTGIQKGHMKMHLLNILNQLGADEKEKTYFTYLFKDKIVSYQAVLVAWQAIKKNK